MAKGGKGGAEFGVVGPGDDLGLADLGGRAVVVVLKADEALKAAKDTRARIEAELTAAIGDTEALAATDETGTPYVYATRKNYHRDGYTVAPTDYRRLTVLARPRKAS